MAQVIEIDALTGEVIERDYTTAEAEQVIKDQQDAQAAYDAAIEQAATDAIVREDAIALAKSLGFTDAMIAVMYPGLVTA